MPTALKFPTDVRTNVWRLLVRTLKADPILHREVETWLVWDEPLKNPFLLSPATSPAICLTPILGGQKWYSPDSLTGPLTVKIEADILSWNVDDYINMWGAIERALYPADRTAELALEQAFRDAGAETGQWNLNQPIADPRIGNPEAGQPPQFNCIGTVAIDVNRVIRP